MRRDGPRSSCQRDGNWLRERVERGHRSQRRSRNEPWARTPAGYRHAARALAASNATAAGSSSSALASQCGDIGWNYINGLDDRGGMVCRISCGYQWIASDLGWRAPNVTRQRFVCVAAGGLSPGPGYGGDGFGSPGHL
jgi:hypothetical protein